MDILKKYKRFINESVDTNNEVNELSDVPQEVIETAKKIASDIFDKVRKPSFDFKKGEGLIMKFNVTVQDFKFADSEEPLKLDMTEGARKKRTYDVTLTYYDSISETYEVQYLVSFEPMKNVGIIDIDNYNDEDDEDVIIHDDFYKNDEDDDYDEDIIDKKFFSNKKGKIDLDEFDLNDFDLDD